MPTNKLSGLLFLIGLSHANAATPSQEQLFQLDLQRQFPADEIQLLSAGEQQFLALQKSAMTAFTKGTVILIPDWSQHAASPNMINVLRQQLIDYGWNTLAINVPEPLLETNAEQILVYQSVLQQRLGQIMESLQDSNGHLIVIAQGSSGALINSLFQAKELPVPDALILLSAYLAEPALNQAVSLALAKHKIPTLDIQQQTDHPVVMASRKLRLQLVQKHLKEMYRQRILPGSVYHAQNQQWLFYEIHGWLSYLGY